LNVQAVCDARGRFLDMSVVFPGSSSDCLAFEGSSLFQRLEAGLLDAGLCLFGDNAYINDVFMATPFSGVSGGTKDSYNFYHSQLRIRIECAFGMLVHRWSILRRAIPNNISIKKTVALTIAAAKLHNFCIDEKDMDVAAFTPSDELNHEMGGGIPLDTVHVEGGQREVVPRALLGGGHHTGDIPRSHRRQRMAEDSTLPQ